LKDRPLADAMKDDHKVFREAMHELAAIERIKRLESEAKTDPKKRLALMMYKAKRKMDQKAKETEEESDVANKLYNPKRQDFVMIYILRK
jgi:site-specific DNA-adenine methylase